VRATQPDPPLTLLEHHATPGEFMGERDAAAAAGDLERLAKLDASLTGIDLAKFSDPQPFHRIPIASGATLYRGPGARRRLLIGFGGRGAWIGPPVPVFLQCIDATRWDVLILRDPQLCHFRNGVAGVGKTFATVTSWLAPKAAKYNHVTCLGYSAGGLPAVWAGMALGADRVICVSAQRPRDVNRLFKTSAVPTAFDAACACVDGSVSRPFAFFHAATHTEDAGTAQALAAQTGGSAVGAEGYNMHSLLGYMWMRGHLQGFLDLALMAPMNANLQRRMTQHLRLPAAPFLSARPNQIPTVTKGVAPNGD
jgi:hypothetical protein